MDDGSRFEREFIIQTDGDTVTVTIFEQNGAREVYNLKVIHAATGTGT